MTRIESNQVAISQSPEEVFNFLSDFNNYQQLMPEQVSDWVSDTDTCSFNIKGMASLGMAIESRTPFSQIKIRKNGKAPFDFFLTCEIGESGDQAASTLKLYFDADLNPFLKMMAEKPLTNFLNLLVNRYRDITSGIA
ncbi:MAG: SRPBCC family protein [Bacteroidota bacterium]|nr:SRPBCC family protein [Bacteroidota bacterium]